jgi:hypothetical protein
MLNKRVQSEIDNFFCKLYKLPEEARMVSSSAFTQCRDKINATAFMAAGAALVDFFYRSYSYKRYYGWRLIAVDGSVYTLPKTPAMVAEFGDNVLSERGKWIKAQVTFAADVLNNICVDAIIGAYKEGEAEQAKTLIERLGKCNLYLFDRGFFGRQFLQFVAKTGCQFCFRVQRSACLEVIRFIESGKIDDIGEIVVEKDTRVKVRFTKVMLNTGEPEYLVSSLLDTRKFSPAKLKELYHLRWGVEEQFKDMKYAICVENFIGKKPNSVKQEFFANILTYNLSMMAGKGLIDKASNKTKKKSAYKTNKRALLAKIKQCFVRLFFGVEQVSVILTGMVKSLAKESIPIRYGRSFTRGTTLKAKQKTYRAYVPVV